MGIGQTGVATNFLHLQRLCQDHHVNPEGFQDQTNEKDHLKVLFEEVAEKRYVPRSVMLDLEQSY